MAKYYRTAHLVCDCKYHVIFCPKYRRKILKNGLDGLVKNTFLEIAHQKDFQILEMEVMPDHVHLLISCNPRFGIMNCVRALKRYSVSSMCECDSSLIHRLPNIWTRSVFIASVGSVSLETVKAYFESQKEQ